MKEQNFELLAKYAYNLTSESEEIEVKKILQNPLEILSYNTIINDKNKFDSYQDYMDWLNQEDKASWEKLKSKMDIDKEHKEELHFNIRKFIPLIILTIIILTTLILFFLNRPTNNELTIFADNQLQTNELPTLPPKYETVLSTDDRPKELAKAYNDREYKKAITLIREEQANPENEFIKSELDFILAVCYLRTGKNKKAIGLLKPITLDNSTYSSDAKLELSYAYIKTGDYKKAYDLSIDIKENSSSFYQKEAEETIKEILEFKPGINQN